MYSAIARIEHYKHYQAGAVHKEAVRELVGYKNPNYDPARSSENHYFHRMEMDKPFEQWIYDYREKNNIAGRYLEHSKNPKSETNAMCQAFFAVPNYIRQFDREEQIQILGYCWDFFKEEFPDVPVLESVIHFDETEPHLQVNFLPVVEREHKKRGKEKIFSTTALMPGVDFFPKYQDRFYQYMQERLSIELERKKGSKAKHLSPKEFRQVTAELKALEEEKEEVMQQVQAVKEDCAVWSENLADIKSAPVFDKTLKLYERIRDLERENKLLKSFLSMVFKKIPSLERIFSDFMQKSVGRNPTIDKTR